MKYIKIPKLKGLDNEQKYIQFGNYVTLAFLMAALIHIAPKAYGEIKSGIKAVDSYIEQSYQTMNNPTQEVQTQNPDGLETIVK